MQRTYNSQNNLEKNKGGEPTPSDFKTLINLEKPRQCGIVVKRLK